MTNKCASSGYIGIIGLGNLGSSMAKRLAPEGYNVIGSRIHECYLDGVQTTTDNRLLTEKSGTVIITVKQKDLDQVVREIEGYAENKLLLSAVAGIGLEYYDCKLPSKNARIMTNLGFARGNASSGYCLGERCTEEDETAIRHILLAGGAVCRLYEDMLGIFTNKSGCSRGFLALSAAYQADAIESLEAADFDRKETEEIIARNMIDIGQTVLLEGKAFSGIAQEVASGGGMTEAGYRVMDDQGMKRGWEAVFKGSQNREKELDKLRKLK